MPRKKLKSAVYETKHQDQVHDRRTSDLPINSVVSVAVVDDPYSDIGEKVSVIRSIRDDPLAGMLSREQIDIAQFEAGRLWQRYHEESEIGTVKAIDPTREAVDGGRIHQAITDRQVEAVKELAAADKALGEYDSAIIRLILGQRKSIGEVCEMWCMHRDRERRFIGKRFRESLETLAVLWNLASNGTCVRTANHLDCLQSQ